MKWLLAILLFFLLAEELNAEDKPEPTMPDEVTLTSGRVLKKVKVVRWEKDRVVLMYAGGVDPIAFSLIKSLSRDDLEAIRAEAKRGAGQSGVPQMRALPTQYHGRVFVVTRGPGNYKMSGVAIYILPEDAWPLLETTGSTISLPAPLTKQVSDTDGRFEFAFPKGLPFVLLAQARRLSGSHEERYEWRLRSQDMNQLPTILLANDTLASEQRKYDFAGE